MKKILLITIIGGIAIGIFYVGIISYGFSNSARKVVNNNPYEIFFKQVRINGLTDTILVQNRTKVFGCGTEYNMYREELNKTGLNKYYEKYGTVLPNLELTTLFEKNNKVKILWIYKGIEGELFQLEDSTLHKKKSLEKRLISEKTFLSFDDNPKSLDSVTITLLVDYKKQKSKTLKYFVLSKNNKEWIIDKEYEEKIIDGL